MAKGLTKTEARRLVTNIESKTKKLFIKPARTSSGILARVVSVQDMAAIEKLCAKWMNRLK